MHRAHSGNTQTPARESTILSQPLTPVYMCIYTIYTLDARVVSHELDGSMDDDFILSKADGRPMYLQIIDQIRGRIAVGDWPPGFKLPSIRELGITARVSVITVKRAYQELEAEGLIVTQHGKGSFVAEIDGLDTHLKEEELDKLLRKAIELARSLGIQPEDLRSRLSHMYGPTSRRKGRRK